MNNKIKRIALDGFLLAILIVASKISFSVLTVAFSLQLLAVLIISKLTSTVDGILIIAIYLVMGLIGIPVFATANAGISYALLPSFGFIIGFIAVVLFVNQFKDRIKNTFVLFLLATVVDYIIGFIYAVALVKVFGLIELDLTIIEILFQFIIVFIPFDIVKGFIAKIITDRLVVLHN